MSQNAEQILNELMETDGLDLDQLLAAIKTASASGATLSTRLAALEALHTAVAVVDYPHVGPRQSTIPIKKGFGVADTGNAAVYLGAGTSGVIREFLICVGDRAGGLAWTDLDNYELRVYQDAGTIAASDRDDPYNGNTPFADKLGLRLPLSDILGANYASAPTEIQKYDSQYVQASWLTIGTEPVVNFVEISITAPMPFSNGILIQLWHWTGTAWEIIQGGADAAYYVTCLYESGTLPTATYSTWRLRGGLVGESYCNGTADAAGETSEFINTVGEGLFIGILNSCKNADSNPLFWEAQPQLDIDGVAAAVKWSGTEELKRNTQPYYMRGVMSTPMYGTTSYGADTYEEGYAWFTTPFQYTTSITGYIPVWVADEVAIAREARIASLYYGPMPAYTARTATADGTDTGVIAADCTHVLATSANADHILTLPAAVVGRKLWIQVGANGYKLQSSAPATIAINGGTGAAVKMTAGANTVAMAECTAENTWVVKLFATDGTFTSPAAE